MCKTFSLAVCLGLLVGIADGQFQPIDPNGSMGSGKFIEPPRAVTQQLRLAESAIEQRRFGEAVATLGELLQRERIATDDELSGQDFFIGAGNSGTVPQINTSLIGEARRLLSSLPADGIAQYELIYGAQARKLLDDAAVTRSWSDVAEVKRRFFHTEAGRDATALLIHHAFSQGNVVQAGRLASMLVEHPKLDAKTKQLVTALVQSLETLTADNTTAENSTVGVPKFAALRLRRDPAATDFRNWDRHQVAAEAAGGQLPLPDPLYTVYTTGSEKQERALRETADSMAAMGELPPPSWLPLRVGNQLLMRTTERLVGVDFTTGKRVWQYPWFEASEQVESQEADLDGMPDDDSGNSLLKQRVWNDLPYGHISSDGIRVFVLGDLAQMEVAMFSPLMGIQGRRPTDTGRNSLVALDLATEGKLVWQLGGDVPDTEPLSDVFFLGAPLPVDGALYVMAEISGDIVLLCLDAATGTERWRQQLLAIETGSIDLDPVRRVSGASASYQNGVLVCCTGAGAIVAVDLLDRSLLWGVAVERNDALNQTLIGRRDGFIPDQLSRRWWDCTPLIVGKSVFVTPIESDRLFALDLLTGNKLWKEVPRTQTTSRYVAGIHDGAIVLVGGDNVQGIDAKTSKRVWRTTAGWLDSGEQISGVGMFGMIDHPTTHQSEPAYFVPTSSNRIIAVSLRDGSALAHRTTTFPTGNLIAVDGQIISQAVTLLAVADGQVSLAPKVAAALQSNPENVEMMNRQAQLLIEAGDRTEALKWLDKARGLDPENIEVQQLTINAMFGALREDFIANGELLSVLDRLIDQPADRAELIKLQIRAAIDRKLAVEAVGRLIDLSTLLSSDPTLAMQAGSGETGSSRTVALDSWINARVTEALEVAQPAQRKTIEATISKHANKYATGSTGQVQRMVHQFGSLPGSEPMIRELLDRYAADQQWLLMERVVLASASTTPDHLDRLAPWQALSLAKAYAGGGLKQDAAAALKVAMTNPEQANQAATELGIDLAALQTQSAGGTYGLPWEGAVSVQMPNNPIVGQMAVAQRVSVSENKRVTGRSFAGWQLVSTENSPVALRDPLGNVHPIPVDGRNRPEDNHRQVVFNGGLMIALLPGELIAVNLFGLLDGEVDPVLWRRPWRIEGGNSTGFRPRSESTSFGDQSYRYLLSTGSSPSELQLGPIVGDTFYLLQGRELIAMDAVTNEIHWRNFEAPRGGAVVCDGQTVAIVSPTSQMIVKYDCRDGKRLGEEPFVDGWKFWSATDEAVLLYRDLPEGKRELILKNPISGEVLLSHTFDGLQNNVRVLGRIIEGTYAVTLSSTGNILIWDLENARVVSDLKVDAIPELSALHVLPRLDSLVLLPAVSEVADDSGSVPTTTASGDDHVRVDVAAWAIDLTSGQIAWSYQLGKEPWGCTLTQSAVSPLVMFSRSKARYLPPGSRAKSIDVLAIDVRDGTAHPSLDQPVESFISDIATRVTVQPPQQRVIVNVGPMIYDYAFGERINTNPLRQQSR